eukprot:CAMPEP_0172492596 /NCGR_PEP_ID=MMETSP1066-20121228/23811_1 /TAXON_ID=671091 /ORGANISM="Coscinodiscus wailesii, Strain CCMP2513" /LENGTH=667 /DNA_ID=CAMNT_0013262317 /DNA_START=491 /DNA_END=2494 /DNA_ORIENTATION=+
MGNQHTKAAAHAASDMQLTTTKSQFEMDQSSLTRTSGSSSTGSSHASFVNLPKREGNEEYHDQYTFSPSCNNHARKYYYPSPPRPIFPDSPCPELSPIIYTPPPSSHHHYFEKHEMKGGEEHVSAEKQLPPAPATECQYTDGMDCIEQFQHFATGQDAPRDDNDCVLIDPEIKSFNADKADEPIVMSNLAKVLQREEQYTQETNNNTRSSMKRNDKAVLSLCNVVSATSPPAYSPPPFLMDDDFFPRTTIQRSEPSNSKVNDSFTIDNNEFSPTSYFMRQNCSKRGNDVTAKDTYTAVPTSPFDEFVISETLQKGAISTVYKALWKQKQGQETIPSLSSATILPSPNIAGHFGVKVALKVATAMDEPSDDLGTIDDVKFDNLIELSREAMIASRLIDHENVCKLLCVSHGLGYYSLAYEYCDNLSLQHLLTTSTHPIPPEIQLTIARDIATGMAHIHSRNIIHRDLKPSNIFLTKTHRAKIGDFGLSTTLRDGDRKLTAETGTYRYMAPEVIRHEHYSQKADVYSFAIVLWQLFTGELVPFEGLTPLRAAYIVASSSSSGGGNGNGCRPSLKQVPRVLRRVIKSCWEDDADLRPSFSGVEFMLGNVTLEDLLAEDIMQRGGCDKTTDGVKHRCEEVSLSPAQHTTWLFSSFSESCHNWATMPVGLEI